MAVRQVRHMRDAAAGGAIFALGFAFLLLSGRYSRGAEVFPELIAIIMMVCAALLVVRALFFAGRSARPEEPVPPVTGRMVVAIIGTIVYAVAVGLVGFVTASLVFVPALSMALGMRRPLVIGVTTIAFVLLIHAVFERIFHVFLPRDLLFFWL